MQWVYSGKFAGGGLLLSLLLVGQGFWAVHAILGSALLAAGSARQLATIMGVSLIPALPVFVILVYLWGSLGAALASIVFPCCGVLLFGVLLRQRLGGFLYGRSMANIGLAGALMFLTHALFPQAEGEFILPLVSGVVVYVATLVLSEEITPQDFAAFLFWQKAE